MPSGTSKNQSAESIALNHPIPPSQWPDLPPLLRLNKKTQSDLSCRPQRTTSYHYNGTRPSLKHARGCRPRGHTTASSMPRAGEIDTQASLTSEFDSKAPTALLATDVDQTAKQANSQNGLRQNRQPRYRCGTCGLRDCSDILALNTLFTFHTAPRKTPVDKKPQPLVQLGILLVTICAENLYTGLNEKKIST